MLYRYSPLLPNPHVFHRRPMDGGQHVWGSSTEECPHGIGWIYNVFGDCVDTNIKLLGFVIGCISLLLWLVPLFPQLYENYRNKRCEGLSVYFLLFWVIGDTCNMLGAVLTHQQPLQQIIGVYYILQDMVLLSQFTYYNRIRPTRQTMATEPAIVVPFMLLGIVATLSTGSAISAPPQQAAIVPLSRTLVGRSLHLSEAQPLTSPAVFESYTDLVGYIIGCLASVCYFAGRLPQLIKNYYRNSCEGLSLAMFIIIVVANLTYGLSVLLETTGWVYLLRHLPWLAGSLGCCFFDFLVIGQYCYYSRKGAAATAAAGAIEREGLLEEAEHED